VNAGIRKFEFDQTWRASGNSQRAHTRGIADAFPGIPNRSEFVVKFQLFSRVAAASVSIIVAAACGPMRTNSTPLNSESAVVYFTNESLDQADVYAVSSSSMRTRIGTVMAGRTEALPIPDVVIGSGDITVAARLLARTGYIDTGPILLHTGDRYSIRLPGDDARTLLVLPASERDILAAQRSRP
jgi:hypothetical protein